MNIQITLSEEQTQQCCQIAMELASWAEKYPDKLLTSKRSQELDTITAKAKVLRNFLVIKNSKI